ncbi:hypothetical protein [Acinetobacter sp.]|uniref:hypothetical protein n=1 Tax=Acinetobacter sp. TaxID=472 RepID=UPI00388E63A1
MSEQHIQTTESQEVPTNGGTATDPTQSTPTDTPAQTPETDPSDAPEGGENDPDIPSDLPESADAYAPDLDGFDFDAFKEQNSEVLEAFHGVGLTNTQLTAVLSAFNEHTQVNIEALQDDWGGEYQQNLSFANQAVQAAGLDMKDVDSPTFGIRLAAHFGKALQEDLPPAGLGKDSGEDIKDILSSEAYMNPNHPEHKQAYAKAMAYYAKRNSN